MGQWILYNQLLFRSSVQSDKVNMPLRHHVSRTSMFAGGCGSRRSYVLICMVRQSNQNLCEKFVTT